MALTLDCLIDGYKIGTVTAVNGPSWTDIASVIVSVGSMAVAVMARRDSRRSSDEAKRSADAAAKLTAIEDERRVDERQQRHDDLEPENPGEIVATLKHGEPTDSLFGWIEVPKSYRVQAEAIFYTGGKTTLGLPMILPPNRRIDFEIEKWPTDSKQPKTKEIKFKFWPPVAGVDAVSPWSCDCGQPTGESLDGPGHWEWTVPVSYYDVKQSVW